MSTDVSRLIDYLEDLKSEEVKKRLIAVRHLSDIAKAFGSEKTRQNLVPFLKEYEDDEEEILIEVAVQMLHISRLIADKDAGIAELVAQFYIVLNYEDYSVINEVG